jgi:hypothetical protein
MVRVRTKMKSNKILTLVFMALFMLVGTAFASPISVSDVNIQESNGDYLAVVSLNNANVLSGVFTEVEFTIEELGTTKNVGVVKVDTNATAVFTYNLMDVTDSFDLLKKGESYQLTVTTDGNSMTEAFLFGSEKDTQGLGLLIESVEMNGNTVADSETIQVMNGESLDVDFRISALENFDDARLMIFIEGYEHSPIVASTEIFQMVAGKTYFKSLSVNLPADMDTQAEYKIRVAGANDLSGITYKEYTVYVDTDRHRVDVVDLVMTPSSGVEPGQNIIANVRMKNRGQKNQDSVKVTVQIPELGVSESSYVSNLNNDEVATSDDMLLFVPEDAAAQEYEVKVSLSYDDGYTSSSKSYALNVLSPRVASEKNLLVSFKNNANLVANQATSFEVVVANPNENSRPISVVAMDNAWADVEVSPTLAMVQGGASATYTVTVTPKSAIAGEKELPLLIKEGTKVVNEFSVDTYVEGSDSSVNWTNIVLAALLIIAIIVLLSLVITIAKRKNEDEDEVSSTEEYY